MRCNFDTEFLHICWYGMQGNCKINPTSRICCRLEAFVCVIQSQHQFCCFYQILFILAPNIAEVLPELVDVAVQPYTYSQLLITNSNAVIVFNLYFACIWESAYVESLRTVSKVNFNLIVHQIVSIWSKASGLSVICAIFNESYVKVNSIFLLRFHGL